MDAVATLASGWDGRTADGAAGVRPGSPDRDEPRYLTLLAGILTNEAQVALTCQRCLQPVETPLELERSLRFVPGEAEAAALDADSEEDVLALPRWLDLRELAEDELLLALPIVPRHEQCPVPLPSAAGEEEVARENPFAALQALKTGGRH